MRSFDVHDLQAVSIHGESHLLPGEEEAVHPVRVLLIPGTGIQGQHIPQGLPPVRRQLVQQGGWDFHLQRGTRRLAGKAAGGLRYIRAAQEPCTVLVIVDAVSRKYFTSETSWLWDIDFDQLNAPQVQRIILSGRYCNDLAERFSFTDIPREKVTVQADIPAAAAELKADGSENVYVVTCFSDRDKILSQVVKEA